MSAECKTGPSPREPRAILVAIIAALCPIFFVAPSLAADADDARAAAKSFFAAMAHGDLNTLREMSVGTTPEIELVEATATTSGAQRKLSSAAAERFGEEGKRGFPLAATQVEDRIQTGEVQVDGDIAAVTPTGGDKSRPIRLRKFDGKWKLELSSVNMRGDVIDAGRMRMIGDVIIQTTAEIQAGKYAKVADAQAAIGQRLNAIATGGARPGPATRP